MDVQGYDICIFLVFNNATSLSNLVGGNSVLTVNSPAIYYSDNINGNDFPEMSCHMYPRDMMQFQVADLDVAMYLDNAQAAHELSFMATRSDNTLINQDLTATAEKDVRLDVLERQDLISLNWEYEAGQDNLLFLMFIEGDWLKCIPFFFSWGFLPTWLVEFVSMVRYASRLGSVL